MDLLEYYTQETAADPTKRSYSWGETAARHAVPMARKYGSVAVDIETEGLGEKAFRIKCLIVSTEKHSCVLDPNEPRHCAAFRDALAAATELVFHNAAFDVPPLVCAGLMTLAQIDKVFDTLVCARMALTGFGARRGLADLEKLYLSKILRNPSKDKFAYWAKISGLTKARAFEIATYRDHPVYRMYAGWDGILTSLIRPRVYEHALTQLTDHPFGRYGADLSTARYLIDREQQVNRVMLRRSARGLELDTERLATEQMRLALRMDDVALRLAEDHGVADPSNRNQLVAALDLAEVFGEDYPRTKTGKISTAKENLATITHEAAVLFREHDQLRRLATYFEHCRLMAKFDGKIHPQANVLHARTGRLSYGHPELHQFTADARTVVAKDPDCSGLVSIDWSSIEPVTVANLAGDLAPIERFEAGEKLYDVVSQTAGVDYKTAKVVVLAGIYGQGITALSDSLGTSPGEAATLQDQVFGSMPRTRRFMGWSAAWSEETGQTWTLSGRIVDVDKESGYKGTNYSVQGSAYDVLSETVVAMDDQGLADGLYLTMHDECVVAEEVAHDVRKIMQTPPARLIELSGRVPKLRTDAAFLGEHWDDADRCPAWPVAS